MAVKDAYRFRKWNRWLDVIYADIQSLLVNRHIFQEVQAIIKANPKLQVPSSFYEWMGVNHAASIAVGIRRQLDMDSRSVSLVRLLMELKRYPEVITRRRFVALYKGHPVAAQFAHRDFDGVAGYGRSYASPGMVRSDLARLKQIGQRLRRFVNKRIAHLDRRKYKNPPTYQEVDECLEVMETFLRKYVLMFRAEAHVKILPTWQYDWKAIFRVPWIV